MILGSYVQNKLIGNYYAKTIPYREDELTWCVRHASPVSTSSNIHRVFPVQVFVVLGFIYAIGIIVVYVIMQHDSNDRIKRYSSFYICLMVALPAGIGQNRRFVVNKLPLRIHHIIISFCGVTGSAIWSSYLMKNFAMPPIEPQMDSVNLLVKNNFTLICDLATRFQIYHLNKVCTF